MTIKDRRAEIVGLVSTRQQMSVDELALELQVSRETIRRDLVALHEEGRLRKFHGGARTASAGMPIENPYPQRLVENVEAKHSIAASLCGHLRPGDTLMIDTGSTTLILAEHLARVDGITVITNAPRIAELVASNTSNRVYLLGGAFNPVVGESLGPLVLDQIARFRATYAVLTVGAIGTEGIMDYDLQEAEVARAMIARADQILVLADASKLDRRAVFDVAPLGAVSRLFTNAAPVGKLAEAMTAAGVLTVVG